jgi:hypothetical protein
MPLAMVAPFLIILTVLVTKHRAAKKERRFGPLKIGPKPVFFPVRADRFGPDHDP